MSLLDALGRFRRETVKSNTQTPPQEAHLPDPRVSGDGSDRDDNTGMPDLLPGDQNDAPYADDVGEVPNPCPLHGPGPCPPRATRSVGDRRASADAFLGTLLAAILAGAPKATEKERITEKQRKSRRIKNDAQKVSDTLFAEFEAFITKDEGEYGWLRFASGEEVVAFFVHWIKNYK